MAQASIRWTSEARLTINAWVEKQTANKIKDLIRPGVLNSRTTLVLANAIYFKGDWLKQFDKGATKAGSFYMTSGHATPVSMMHQRDRFHFLDQGSDGDAFQVLELPYKGESLSMIIFLPAQPAQPPKATEDEPLRFSGVEAPPLPPVNGLPALEQSLSGPRLDEKLSKLKVSSAEVDVTLPKFRIEAEFGLNGTLARMGMPLAFDSNADFSGIDGTRDLFISAVVHKAYVAVDEEGTEAAAATAGAIEVTMLQRTAVFRADHPFVFLIRDNRSGSILFMGRLADPPR
jgi:serpin B